MSDFVFGYGSLAAALPQAVAELQGFRRRWGVAMDNTRTIPGYKVYEDAGGARPAVHVAFLDLQPDPGAAVNGVLLPAPPETLAALDARERNYERIEVTAQAGAGGRVWAYVGRPEARERLEAARRAGTAVVQAAYERSVLAAFGARGARQLERFHETTQPHGLPVLDLRRIDLPDG